MEVTDVLDATKFEIINKTLEMIDYSLISKQGSTLQPGDFAYLEVAGIEKFYRIIATRYEQGSGPRPSRNFVALANCSQIVEVSPHDFYCVLSPK